MRYALNPIAAALLASPISDSLEMSLPVGDGETQVFDLHRVSQVNSAETFDGKTYAPLAGNAVSYRGRSLTEPATRAHITLLSEGEVMGVVWQPGLYTQFITPIPMDADGVDHVLGQAPTLPDIPTSCVASDDGMVEPEAGRSDAVKDERITARILVDVGFDVYQGVFGSDANATRNYMTGLFGAVSDIYESEINVEIVISRMIIWTAQDPFDLPTARAQFEAYRDYGRVQYGAEPRHAAHLIKSGNTAGYSGYARIGELCSTSNAYGVSNIKGIYTFPRAGWSGDVLIVAHELGHNFGSAHTHCYVPPIDCCSTECAACPNAVAQLGTIMSYCHRYGTQYMDFVLGDRVRDVIRAGAENAPCNDLSTDGHPVDTNNDRQLQDTELSVALTKWLNGAPDAFPDADIASAVSLWLSGGCYQDTGSNWMPASCT